MNIRNATDGQIAELMGDIATDHDARVMRQILTALDIVDTRDVSDHLWMDLLSIATRVTTPSDGPSYEVDVIMADPETGRWYTTPVCVGTVSRQAWDSMTDTGMVHYDTYETRADGVTTVTRAILVVSATAAQVAA